MPRHLRRFPILVLLISTATVPADPVPPAVPRVIEPFDYRGVSLDGGPLKAQLDDVRAFYAGIPEDSLLKGFRKRAGLPAPGNDLGGWYGTDVFHTFGQLVSGYARLYAATGDARFRDKANRLVAEWAKCIAPDGYFFFSDRPFARHYIYDKLLWGLLDNHLYCGNTNALDHLSRITDWAVKNLDRTRNVNDTATEWYTLSENLYRAWRITGDARYRDFARVWEYPAYWGLHERHDDIFATRPDGSRSDVYHAYSHVNTLGGCGAAFLATGDARYLAALTNAYDYFQREQVFATGGFGPDEKLLPTGPRCASLGETHKSFETQCSSWAVFKLGKYLLSLTGDARYGDWIEQLAINGVGASIPMSADGRVFYYADYNLHGARKRNIEIPWSCCTGTRPQAVADLTDLVWFKEAQNLFVNLYAPATVRWPRAGGIVTVKQQTDFPLGDTVRFEVSVPKPARFGLKFRVPRWLAAPLEAKVNGRKVKLDHDRRHWAGITRRWKHGDCVELRLPMALRAVPVAAGAKPTAVCYGPTTLAFQSADIAALRGLDASRLTSALLPVAGEPLHFRLASDRAARVQPFFSLPEGERYFLYLAPDMGSRISHEDLHYAGRWNASGNLHYSNEPGATAEVEFAGTGVRWIGWKFDDAGHAEVSLDGKRVAVVDQFGPGRDLPFDWSVRDLAPGRHTIRLTVREERSPQSKDRFINVGGFEILEAQN